MQSIECNNRVQVNRRISRYTAMWSGTSEGSRHHAAKKRPVGPKIKQHKLLKTQRCDNNGSVKPIISDLPIDNWQQAIRPRFMLAMKVQDCFNSSDG